jgi:hypothetical protein
LRTHEDHLAQVKNIIPTPVAATWTSVVGFLRRTLLALPRRLAGTVGIVNPTGPKPVTVASWHAVVDSRDPARLADLLAEDVVFRSPAVYTAQEGKGLTTAYLAAAMVVLGPTLRYVEEWYSDRSAVLEFEAELDGTFVQGIDMLRRNDEDRLVEFIVMVRPFRGLEKLIELMGRQLRQ